MNTCVFLLPHWLYKHVCFYFALLYRWLQIWTRVFCFASRRLNARVYVLLKCCWTRVCCFNGVKQVFCFGILLSIKCVLIYFTDVEHVCFDLLHRCRTRVLFSLNDVEHVCLFYITAAEHVCFSCRQTDLFAPFEWLQSAQSTPTGSPSRNLFCYVKNS